MTKKSPWIVSFKPLADAKARLFCFPYAGAGPSIFRTWHEQVSSEIEILAINLPGRERRIREPLLNDIANIISGLTTAILPYLDRPFIFFGHSLGALLSFELSRQLRSLNAPLPSHLFVSARHAPHILNPNPPIHQLPEPEFLKAIEGYNGIAPQILQNADLMPLYSAILRADLTINETYIYNCEQFSSQPFDFPISVFGGQEDHLVNVVHLESWRCYTTANFNLQIYSGNHFFLREQQEKILQIIVNSILKQLVGMK